jgi:lipopolysaccharide export system protein LptA
MPLDVQRLRRWLGIGMIAMVALVAAFILYGRYRVRRVLREVPQKMGVDIKQSTEGFTLSKSEGGRTLFTISAKKAVQYQQGGHAELHDVNILVYGRQANRFDQIYGSDFSYNPQSGDIQAQGEVHIDLESDAGGPVRPDQTPPAELKNPIHLKTSGVVFNQKTGFAATPELIDFRVPQASGTAKGATYDSKNNVLTLQSAVRLKTAGPESADITAQHGVITKEPRRAVLEVVHIQRQRGSMDADRLTVFLRSDNSVERMMADGNVRVRDGRSGSVQTPMAEASLTGNVLRGAMLSGGVTFEQGGASPSRGHAGRVALEFGARNQLTKVRALDEVRISEQQKSAGRSPQVVEIAAPAISSALAGGRLDKAQTSGASQITIRPANQGTAASPGPTGAKATEADATTVITAGQFDLIFEHDRMKQLHGAPDARIVSSLPGQPERVSTSRDLTVAFDAAGAISSLLQVGDVRYTDGPRTATAQRARYSPGDGMLVLTGAPRASEGGLVTTAQTIRFDRNSGDATAEGEVKTTYNQSQGGAVAGPMFSSSDPIHVTAASMLAHRSSSTARYTGGARLWQGANIVQAPVITFDRDRHDVTAQGSPDHLVSTVFVQGDSSGKVTPLNVIAKQLTYTDVLRKARFEGGVVLKGADLTVQADHADVFLLTRGQKAGPGSASQVERLVAEGHVEISQPERNARGDTLTYLPAEGKFVLTGGPPSIFDAEHGSISGDSLTFYRTGAKVVVGSSGTSRTVTQTRVSH